ncbi:MAG: hypothetical protein CL748_03110 [Chloroflexi bacterium]|nr:hypothetical protein [Chloroflexota bacterium]
MDNFINHYSLIIFTPIIALILLLIFFKISKNKFISFILLFITIFGVIILINSFSPKESDKNINSNEILSANKVKFVQVYSQTCLGCIINEPIIRDLEVDINNEFSLDVVMIRLNVSDKKNFDIIKNLNAFTTPSYIILSDKNIVIWKQSGGLLNKNHVVDEIKNHIVSSKR